MSNQQTQAEAGAVEIVNEIDWLELMQGRTIRGVRPVHEGDSPIPKVHVLFTDDTAITISVKPGVYFEACFINTLRKAQPVTDVLVVDGGNGSYTLQVRARTFPLMELAAINKDLPADEFPFELARRVKH